MEAKLIRDTDTAHFEAAIIHRWDRFGVGWWMAAVMTSRLDLIAVWFLLAVGGCRLKTSTKPRTCEGLHSFRHRWEPAFAGALFQLRSSFDWRRFHGGRSWLGARDSTSQPLSPCWLWLLFLLTVGDRLRLRTRTETQDAFLNCISAV